MNNKKIREKATELFRILLQKNQPYSKTYGPTYLLDGQHTYREVLDKLGSKIDITKLRAYLSCLKSDGEIDYDESDPSQPIRLACKTVSGVFKGVRDGNYGFVSVGDKQDIYIQDRGAAQDGDVITVALKTVRGRQEGFFIEVTQKNTGKECYVGDVIDKNGEPMFIPLDKSFEREVKFDPDLKGKARTLIGKKIGVSILRPALDCVNVNKIFRVLGQSDDPILENILIAEEFGFSKEFPEDVMKETESLPDSVSLDEKNALADITGIPFCTIDPESCKDVDDAIYVKKLNDGRYIAYVALAHVSHYVKKGGKIDKEAYRRGTSCYLGDGVYPMLPEKLSNGICSLNPHVDRRVICGKFYLSSTGEVLQSEFFNGVMNSRAKLSYEQAQDIHENKLESSSEIKNSIDAAFEVSDLLIKKRRERGALDISSEEISFEFDESRTKVKSVKDKSGLASTKVIESLMILYNEEVGQLFKKRNLNALYRVHKSPTFKKLQRLQGICKSLNITFYPTSDVSCIAGLLKEVKGTVYEEYINSVVVRSLPKAYYSASDIGHFALASKHYIHSTAAIRRYPDIITQRILDDIIDGPGRNFQRKNELAKEAEHLSRQEIEADKAEQASDSLLKTIWAEEHIGEAMLAKVIKVSPETIEVKTLENKATITLSVESVFKGIDGAIYVNDNKTKIGVRGRRAELSVGKVIKVQPTSTSRPERIIYGEIIKDDIFFKTLEEKLKAPEKQQKKKKAKSPKQVHVPDVQYYNNRHAGSKNLKYFNNNVCKI